MLSVDDSEDQDVNTN